MYAHLKKEVKDLLEDIDDILNRSTENPAVIESESLPDTSKTPLFHNVEVIDLKGNRVSFTGSFELEIWGNTVRCRAR